MSEKGPLYTPAVPAGLNTDGSMNMADGRLVRPDAWGLKIQREDEDDGGKVNTDNLAYFIEIFSAEKGQPVFRRVVSVKGAHSTHDALRSFLDELRQELKKKGPHNCQIVVRVKDLTDMANSEEVLK